MIAFKPFRALATLAVFAASSAAALAAPVSVTLGSGTIAAHDSVSFSLNIGASATPSFTAAIRGTGVIGDVFSLSLFDSSNKLVSTFSTLDVVSALQKKETFTNKYADLLAGTYTLKMVSGINGGAYSVGGTYEMPSSSVPEPLSMSLSLAGVVAVLAMRRRAR
jgi:hypothetical protein